MGSFSSLKICKTRKLWLFPQSSINVREYFPNANHSHLYRETIQSVSYPFLNSKTSRKREPDHSESGKFSSFAITSIGYSRIRFFRGRARDSGKVCTISVASRRTFAFLERIDSVQARRKDRNKGRDIFFLLSRVSARASDLPEEGGNQFARRSRRSWICLKISSYAISRAKRS